MFDLTGKKALVTGASGGIGAAIAKALADQGAAVALSGTRQDALETTAATISGESSILTCNLSDPDAVEGLIPAAESALGGLDILVNNAGLTRDMLSMRMKDEEWSQVIDVNLTATFRLCRAVLKGMMKRRWGRIVNITSIVGVTGNPGQANYAASKAGIIGMSKSMASEVATRGITINCVAPGFVATAMTDKLSDKQKSAILPHIPAGRMGTPEDIASAVTYLSSAEAAYITGQTLHVNGGMAMI
ncbi:3-oxoacyl-[acyl-carrier-protein] reductase [Rhodospirillum sp. A1_3_36]|uniref:3-oxoacyl-[acyl-carrier-protein] reductase n=1 Tax=Rhodospirillum sp. A1_3_36 TaxID=3391666 RepID=UPI0039A6074D